MSLSGWLARWPSTRRVRGTGPASSSTFLACVISAMVCSGWTYSSRRVHRPVTKTQGSLPSEDAALILLFGLVASGQIKLRRIDGWRKIAAVLSHHTAVAA